MKKNEIVSIMLSWNRPHLLSKTIRSYFETVRLPHRLTVIDNASDEETKQMLRELSVEFSFEAIFLDTNKGGRAFNVVLDRIDRQWAHFSENDMQYRPGWDETLIAKMGAYPEMGQISPYSPFPEEHLGEIATVRPATLSTRDGQSVYFTKINVSTTCLVRPDVIRSGIRWKNYTRGQFHFPSDGHFSTDIKRKGWKIAWNDCHLVTNWGHNLAEFQQELDYYVESYSSKRFVGLEGWDKRLQKHGYKLLNEEGKYKIVPLEEKDKWP